MIILVYVLIFALSIRLAIVSYKLSKRISELEEEISVIKYNLGHKKDIEPKELGTHPLEYERLRREFYQARQEDIKPTIVAANHQPKKPWKKKKKEKNNE